MYTEKLVIKSDFENVELSALIIASDEPRYVLQIIHGMSEHKGRYIPFMEYMAERGAACIIHDHRGHGESIIDEEDLGYFGDFGHTAMVCDIDKIGDFMCNKYQGLPRCILGHSMGALAARVYAGHSDEKISALVLTGTPAIKSFCGFAIFLTDIVSFFRGEKYRSKFTDKLAFGVYNKSFENEAAGDKFTWISANKANRENYARDHLCGYIYTVNGIRVLLKLLRDTYRPGIYDVKNKNMPVLFMSGESDPLIRRKNDFNNAVQFMRDIGYKNVEKKLYAGMRHEILNETERVKVYDDITAFLNDAVSGENKEV